MATTDLLESARVALGVLLIVSNAIVWYGVYLEREDFSDEIKEKGWRFVVCGIAAETVFSAFLLAVDIALSSIQGGVIAAAHKEASDANLLSSHIEEAAAWRRIDKSAHDRLVEELLRGPGGALTLAYEATDTESKFFAHVIWDIFAEVNSRKQLWVITVQPRIYTQMIPENLRIFGPDPMSPSEGLMTVRHAFRRANVDFSGEPVPNILMDMPSLSLGAAPPADITIFVGPKELRF